VNYIQHARMYIPAMDDTTWYWGDIFILIKLLFDVWFFTDLDHNFFHTIIMLYNYGWYFVIRACWYVTSNYESMTLYPSVMVCHVARGPTDRSNRTSVPTAERGLANLMLVAGGSVHRQLRPSFHFAICHFIFFRSQCSGVAMGWTKSRSRRVPGNIKKKIIFLHFSQTLYCHLHKIYK